MFVPVPRHRVRVAGALLALIALAMAPAPATHVQAPADVLVDTLRRATAARLNAAAEAADGVIGFVIADLDGPDRFSRLEDTAFPAASTIKLAVLYELFRQADAGRIPLDEVTPVDRSRAVPGGLLFELTNPALSMRDLAIAMILESDNTATNVLIERLGMAAVNTRLAELGLRHTRLQRLMIDLDAAREGRENLTTPSDLVRLLLTFHRGDGLSASASTAALAILKKPKQTPIRTGVPPTVEVASKPGGLAGVRADAGIVYLPGRPYVFAAMGTFLLESEDVEAPLEQLARISFEYFNRRATISDFGRQIQ